MGIPKILAAIAALFIAISPAFASDLASNDWIINDRLDHIGGHINTMLDERLNAMFHDRNMHDVSQDFNAQTSDANSIDALSKSVDSNKVSNNQNSVNVQSNNQQNDVTSDRTTQHDNFAKSNNVVLDKQTRDVDVTDKTYIKVVDIDKSFRIDETSDKSRASENVMADNSRTTDRFTKDSSSQDFMKNIWNNNFFKDLFNLDLNTKQADSSHHSSFDEQNRNNQASSTDKSLNEQNSESTTH